MMSWSATTSLVLVLLVVAFLLGIYIAFYSSKALTSRTIHWYFRTLLCIVILLYLVTILSVSSIMIIYGDQFFETVNLLSFIPGLSYCGLLVSASCTFMGRLYFSYNNTQYKLGKTVVITLWTMILIMIILFMSFAIIKVLCEALILSNISQNMCSRIPLARSVVLLLYVTLSLIFVILFSKKLRKIIIKYQIYVQKHNQHLDKKTYVHSKQQLDKKLMNQMSRHLLLALLQFSSTLFIAILAQLYSHYSVLLPYAIIDSIINLLCIILQYQFATNVYNKYCGICDRCCIHLLFGGKLKTIALKADDEQPTNTDNLIPLKMIISKCNLESTYSTVQNTTFSITSTNMLAKINNTTFPPFKLDSKYMEQSELIYVGIMKLKLIISIENIAQLISEYAATLYKECTQCSEQHAFIECYNDCFIINNVLAICDPFCNDEIRYYLVCVPSFSTTIQNNIYNYDEDMDIVCVKCGVKSLCTVCNTQFLTDILDSSSILECHSCKCTICEDCAVGYRNEILCQSCCPESVTVKDNVYSSKYIKSYKSLNSKSSNNNLSKWGNFEF